MAAVVAAAGGLTSAVVPSSSGALASSPRKRASLGGVRRLSAHGGLKAHNQLTAMGESPSTEQRFADLRARCSARLGVSKGGAAASTCDVASEIFTIIPIMSGLVLVGIALGFVLLRVEAAVEDSEL